MDEGRSPVAKVRYRSGRGVMLVFEHTQERDEMEQLLLRPAAVQQEKKKSQIRLAILYFYFSNLAFFCSGYLGKIHLLPATIWNFLQFGISPTKFCENLGEMEISLFHWR